MSAQESRKSSHGHYRKHHYVREWFWSCCNCGAHAGLSTTISIACPGCQHVRCAYCPMESAKISASQIVARRPTATFSPSEAVHRNILPTGPVPAQIKQWEISDDPSSATCSHAPSGSSPGNHGSAVGEPGGSGEYSGSKRPKQQCAEKSGARQGGNLGDSQIESFGCDSDGPQGGTRREDIAKERCADPCKNSGFSAEVPGNNPSITEPLDTRPKFFACHFYKLDARNYGPWTDMKYEKCPGSHIMELCRIKYHLKKVHTQAISPLYCKRCCHSFENAAKLDDHCKALVACKPTKRSSYPKEGIGKDEWEQIECVLGKRGKKGVDDISRWYEIWRILFPGVTEPLSTRVECPGYIARSNCDIADLQSDFDRRIEKDVKNGVLRRDDQTQRYLHHFRQTLEHLSADLRSIQLDDSGTNREKQLGPPSRSQVNSSDSGAAFLKNGDDPERQSTTSLHTTARPSSEKCITVSNTSDLTQQLSNPAALDSPFVQDNEQSLHTNTGLKEAPLSQFWGYDFDSEAADFLRLSALSEVTHQPEEERGITYTCDPTCAPAEVNYFFGDDIDKDIL